MFKRIKEIVNEAIFMFKIAFETGQGLARKGRTNEFVRDPIKTIKKIKGSHGKEH